MIVFAPFVGAAVIALFIRNHNKVRIWSLCFVLFELLLCLIAFFTRLPNITPDSEIIFPSSFIVNFLNVFFNEITIPLNPWSDTSKFDPDPAKKVSILLLVQYVSNDDNSFSFLGKM